MTAFGERANFSPDGSRLVFIGENYGDAFEMELDSGSTRNITRDIPHRGMHRIQYLPNGDYLVTAPRKQRGVNTRAFMEMWVLDKRLDRPLQPLGEKPFEGIAISRQKNLIAWTAVAPEVAIAEDQPWQMLFAKPTKRYIAEITYQKGLPEISARREIMVDLPKACNFVEPQDFRDNDQELVFSCLKFSKEGSVLISVMGYHIKEQRYITYRSEPGEYNEVEGIAPSGNWTTVECGKQEGPGLPRLDICKLQLVPGGQQERLLPHISADELGDVSNPVISPDGSKVVFQKSAETETEYGEGLGLYMARLPR